MGNPGDDRQEGAEVADVTATDEAPVTTETPTDIPPGATTVDQPGDVLGI